MGWWRARPLQVQLVIVVVLLAALAMLAAGFLATAALRDYLLGQVDRQLVQMSSDLERPQPPGDRGPMTMGGPGFPTDFYVVTTDAGGRNPTVIGRPSMSSAIPAIPDTTRAAVVAGATGPMTVPATDGGAAWRVFARPTTDGVVWIGRSVAGVSETVQRLALLQLGIGVVVLTVLSVLAFVVVRRSLAPLHHVEQTATAIAAGDLSRRVPAGQPNTEVGQLSAAVNTMLDEISETMGQRDAAADEARTSEAQMRQFVTDASHELRTPLTTIRGYSELYRQGGVDSGDVPATFARVEGAAQRMSGLVEDLLLLARLDQQRPLDVARTDLLELANDVATDARVEHPDRTFELAFGGGDVPTVLGDPHRLRQVLTNLVTNAVAYSDPGRPVDIGLTTDSDVVVTVADRGPGIPDGEKRRVFERFSRGDGSRSRDQGGSGLGLSIVAAIVEAHGGTVAVSDRDGGGSVFEVRLPRAV